MNQIVTKHSLTVARTDWTEQLSSNELHIQKPLTLLQLVNQPIQLTNIIFRLQLLENLLDMSCKRSIAELEYYTHTLRYFDDYVAKYVDLAITVEGLFHTEEDVSEIVEFLSKHRILTYDPSKDQEPDLKEIGLYFRCAKFVRAKRGFPAFEPSLAVPDFSGWEISRKNPDHESKTYEVARFFSPLPQITRKGGVGGLRTYIPTESLQLEVSSHLPLSYKLPVKNAVRLDIINGTRKENPSVRYVSMPGEIGMVRIEFDSPYDLDEVEELLLKPQGVEFIDIESPILSKYAGRTYLQTDDIESPEIKIFIDHLVSGKISRLLPNRSAGPTDRPDRRARVEWLVDHLPQLLFFIGAGGMSAEMFRDAKKEVSSNRTDIPMISFGRAHYESITANHDLSGMVVWAKIALTQWMRFIHVMMSTLKAHLDALGETGTDPATIAECNKVQQAYTLFGHLSILSYWQDDNSADKNPVDVLLEISDKLIFGIAMLSDRRSGVSFTQRESFDYSDVSRKALAEKHQLFSLKSYTRELWDIRFGAPRDKVVDEWMSVKDPKSLSEKPLVELTFFQWLKRLFR